MKFQINSEVDYNTFQKIPKKNRKFEDECLRDNKKKNKKRYDDERNHKKRSNNDDD